jgi:lysozyme
VKLSLIDIVNEEFKLPFVFRRDGTGLRVSQNFWDWIKSAEGDPKKKGKPMLIGYRDSKGVPTIGYGHTGPDVKIGMKIDEKQALKYLYSDATLAADCLRRILAEWKKNNFKGYKLKQNEFDALVSLIYNSGCEGVRRSIFIQNLKKGDYKNAAKNILNYANKGLANRRKAEYEIFLNGKYNKI